MLRTNLSTRPFYNVRAVQLTLGVFAGLVLGITLFNVVEIIRLSTSQRSLGSHAAEAEAEATLHHATRALAAGPRHRDR